MSAIKDIVDLAKDLESRAKDRRDIDVLHKIHSLAFSLQSQHAEIVERDVHVMEENSKLKRELAEAKAEDIRIHFTMELRRSKRTGGVWVAFCPKCHMPLVCEQGVRGEHMACCTAICGWSPVHLPKDLQSVIDDFS